MSLLLLFVDENGASTGGTAGGGGGGSTYVPAVHKKVGVRQADVPSHGGGSGLAMVGWLRGLRFG